MRRKRHALTPFGLAFMDVMSCGLGATVLLFLIIKHNAAANVPSPAAAVPDLTAEVNLLEKDITEGRKGLAELRNTVAEIDQQIVIAEGLARRIQEQINETAGTLEGLKAESKEDEIAALKAQIEDLEKRRKQLDQASKQTGEAARTFAGEGERQYLTGLKLGGERILVLLDASASMMDRTIVNVIRRSFMADERKRESAKWQQALATVDWLTARMPVSSQYQIYTFNTEVQSAVPDTTGRWLRVNDLVQLNGAVAGLRKLAPRGGTSLHKAFAAARALKPLPDNILLITDGLPTQGQKPPLIRSKVSGKERSQLFDDALKQLPSGIPVNTILLPMEGDPAAAFAYWGLAINTQGSFLTPAEDWP
ncbi:MAG: VWA domain-containing protein [Gammaproteobacteria bacterium]|nr:VWA domain-containing protein [Gammaproteobacteria bacterium]